MDVAVLEVGIGGRLDATNIIPHPVVCGISSLGFDHMELLGNTLGLIAREKGGILKRGSPAFSVEQPEEAMAALQVGGWQIDNFGPGCVYTYLRSCSANPLYGVSAAWASTIWSCWATLWGNHEGDRRHFEPGPASSVEQPSEAMAPLQVVHQLSFVVKGFELCEALLHTGMLLNHMLTFRVHKAEGSFSHNVG